VDPVVADGIPPTLQPSKVQVQIEYKDPGPSILRFVTATPSPGPIDQPMAAENAFVIIAHDYTTLQTNNGHIYRLGEQLGVGEWEIASDYEPKDATENIPYPPSSPTAQYAEAFIIGKGLSDPMTPAAGYAGNAQDISISSTTVSLT